LPLWNKRTGLACSSINFLLDCFPATHYNFIAQKPSCPRNQLAPSSPYGFEPRPRQLLCRDLEQVLHTVAMRHRCSVVSMVVCTSELWKEGNIKYSCIVFYCIDIPMYVRICTKIKCVIRMSCMYVCMHVYVCVFMYASEDL